MKREGSSNGLSIQSISGHSAVHSGSTLPSQQYNANTLRKGECVSEWAISILQIFLKIDFDHSCTDFKNAWEWLTRFFGFSNLCILCNFSLNTKEVSLFHYTVIQMLQSSHAKIDEIHKKHKCSIFISTLVSVEVNISIYWYRRLKDSYLWLDNEIDS